MATYSESFEGSEGQTEAIVATGSQGLMRGLIGSPSKTSTLPAGTVRVTLGIESGGGPKGNNLSFKREGLRPDGTVSIPDEAIDLLRQVAEMIFVSNEDVKWGDVHQGHPDYMRCPARHYWPPDTAEDNWITRGEPTVADTNFFTCPVTGRETASGFRGDLGGSKITDHQVTNGCGHTHRLDLVDGRWVVDGKENT